MKILLTGATGGIGSAIHDILEGHKVTCYRPTPDDYVPFKEKFDWAIFAHGVLNEDKEAETFWVNTLTPIWITKDLVKQVKKGFIYIASTSGLNGNDKFPIYSASKAAIIMYAASMARKHKDISFYALCPGPTDTKMWRGLGLEGTPQDPKEVAKVVHDIMEGKYKSGDIITVRNGKVS